MLLKRDEAVRIKTAEHLNIVNSMMNGPEKIIEQHPGERHQSNLPNKH